MSLVFDNELYDMTSTAKEVLLDDDLQYMYGGDVVFEEFPYFGCRTDLVTVRYDTWALARRKKALGHLTPLPDERRFRYSYNRIQDIEPASRRYWVKEDNTYSTEQYCKEVWDWLCEYGYLVACDPREVGGQAMLGQITLDGEYRGVPANDIGDHSPAITVKFPMSITANAWELKPRDWRTALRQAQRADCYVNYRWVVMDAGGFEPEHEIRRQFIDAGVGLATLDEDGLDISVHPDRVQAPKTAPRFMLNERAVDAMPDGVRDEAEEKFTELAGGDSE